MGIIPIGALIFLCISCSLIPTSVCEPKHQLHHEVTDIRKVFENFPFSVAILDVDKDGDLDCLATVRTDYDLSVPRATYVWIIPGVNGREPQNITYDVVPGETPDVFYFGDKYGDGSFESASFVYTDYKDCIIYYHNERQECMMWTSWETKQAAPQACLDQLEDNCEGEHMPYDEETCSPFFSF